MKITERLDTLAEARAQCYREAAKLLREMGQVPIPFETHKQAFERAAETMDSIAEVWER